MLVAVNGSAHCADRAAIVTRLRPLTAPARSALSRNYVMADPQWLPLTKDFYEA